MRQQKYGYMRDPQGNIIHQQMSRTPLQAKLGAAIEMRRLQIFGYMRGPDGQITRDFAAPVLQASEESRPKCPKCFCALGSIAGSGK